MSVETTERPSPLRLRELAELLGVHQNTMLRYVKEGTVRGFKIGHLRYVSADEADRLIRGGS